MATTTTTWSRLKRGDRIVCPATGRPEMVTRTHRYTAGKWFVRTDGHDHYKPAGATVTLAPTAGAPR